MSQLGERLRLLGMLAANEQVTAELYMAYATRFPAHREFWLHLSGDEVRHHHWVEGLMRQAREGDLVIQEGRFRDDLFLGYQDYVKQRTAEARTTTLTMTQALAIASDLEGTMVERAFFMVLEGDSPALQQVLRNLHHSTEAHAAAIEKKRAEVMKAERG